MIRADVVLLLIATGAVMMVIDRGHTVYEEAWVSEFIPTPSAAEEEEEPTGEERIGDEFGTEDFGF